MSSYLHASAISAFLSLTVAIATASAQDLTPPPWRGAPLSTMQQWSFDSGLAGGAPDVPYHNPYGIPNIEMSGDVDWHATFASPGLLPHNSVVELKKGGTKPTGTTTGGNQNTAFAAASDAGCKTDCLQMTYIGVTPDVAIVPVPGHGDFTVVQDSLSIVPLADGWMHMTVYHTYYAAMSPSAESFVITPSVDGSLFLDNVVFDTVVIPEPCLGFLCVGGLLLGGRRRR